MNSTNQKVPSCGYLSTADVANHWKAEFLFKFFESLSFPVVSANIDLNTTKFLHRIVKPYVILEKCT